MSSLVENIRTAVRSLRKTPLFTVAVVATLSLAIGANTLIFSVVDGVILRPLAFGNASRLMAVVPVTNRTTNQVSLPDLVDWQHQMTRLDALASYHMSPGNLTGTGEPQRLLVALVSPNWFQFLGVPVQRGRAFAENEATPAAPKVIIVSDAFWRDRLGGVPTVLGQSLVIDNDAYTIVGVAPPHFDYPGTPDLWMPHLIGPLDLAPTERGDRYRNVLGRVAPTATAAAAVQEFAVVTGRLRQQYPQAEAESDYTLKPLHDVVVGDARSAILVLFGAVGCVLLIACANVANLMLVRASGRTAELGVRIAIGAGRGALVRQLLTESVLLALLGALGGAAIANGGIHFLIAVRPGNIPRLDDVTLSGRVLLFTIGIATITGVLFGLAPALHASSLDLVEALKSGARGASGHRRTGRIRSALVIVETALAVLLLVGAGLLTRSFIRMMGVDPGFRPEQVVRFDVNLYNATYATWGRLRVFTHGVLDRLQALPGTQVAAAGYAIPFGNGLTLRVGFDIVGHAPVAPEQRPTADLRPISPQFFAGLGIPLRKGRLFTDQDRPGGHQVVIINEAMARMYFGNENPIGRRIDTDFYQDSSGHGDTVRMGGEVVGVVGDTKLADLTAAAGAIIYMPLDQGLPGIITFVVRSTADAATVLRDAQHAVAAVDPQVPIYNAGPLAAAVRESASRPRLFAEVVSAFATVSLLLAVIGIYGVLAFAVRERRREIGIRLALGAGETQVVGLVVGQGLRLAGIGLVIGLVAALLGSRVLGSLLYGIQATDPLTYEIACGALLGVAGFASWLPARRAAIIDPVIAMRPD